MKIYKFDTMGHQINQRMTPVIVRNTPVGIVLVSEVMTTGDSAGKKTQKISNCGLLDHKSTAIEVGY